MNPILETPRLLVREFIPDDAEFILELLNTKGWLQYIGDRNIKTIEDAQNYLLNGPIKSYAQFGFGLYLLQLKEKKASVGMCGILKRESLDDVDLGFALLPAFAGHSYAFEAAAAIMAHEKAKHNMKRIVAITLEDNTRSVDLLKRLGFVFEKTISDGDERLQLFACTV